ncbi:hypothetical protein SynBIOSU31_01138 [Synechococcus sp. BIOS-U3-1]|nr:hypothetical protein SynBIOSU31_01138 [Synechococcus sp. BIOS-U3-1]
MLQTTDQPSRVIIRTLQASTPWETIGASCRGIPLTAELHESQKGEIERSGESHRCWNDSTKTTISSRLRQHQNRNSPGSKSFYPTALTAFVHADITAQSQQGQCVGITDLCTDFAQQWIWRTFATFLQINSSELGCKGARGCGHLQFWQSTSADNNQKVLRHPGTLRGPVHETTG